VRLPPFQRLVDQHAAELHRFLVGSVGVTDADDLLQETLISALRAYPRLRDGRNLRAWLYLIAQRRVADALRRTRRRLTVPLTTQDAAAPDASAPDEDLWDAVRRLPARQRAAVVHRYALDLPYREIAARLGGSEASARQNVHDGLQRLRRMLTP